MVSCTCLLMAIAGVSACDEGAVEVPSMDTRLADTDDCKKADEDCTGDSDCCSGVCRDRVCRRMACCSGAGVWCENGHECCSGHCAEQTCADCRSDGASCNTDEDCCSSRCDVYDGTCVACLAEYRPCESDAACCSGRCDPEHDVCLGCKPAGQTCGTDSDCCGDLGCASDTKICVGCIDNQVDRCGELPCCNRRMDCVDDHCSCPELEGVACEEHGDCCSGAWNEVDFCDTDDGTCHSVVYAGCDPFGPCYGPSRSYNLCGPRCPDYSAYTLDACDVLTHLCPGNRDVESQDARCQSAEHCYQCDRSTEACDICHPLGSKCDRFNLCCSGLCDPVTDTCVGCLAAGRECESSEECCSRVCANGECAGTCPDRG